MLNLLETLWNEPRAPGAPARVWRDWALVAVVVGCAFAEGLLGEASEWRAYNVALTVAMSLTLLWRRTQPLLMAVLAFGATMVMHSLAVLQDIHETDLNTNAFMLILPYALLRWGSGREAVLGMTVIGISFAATVWSSELALPDFIGGSLFLLFPAALGASVRYQDSAQRRATEQVRLREREQLARELHDTVAHHVSAIAIQAQAGRALAATQPDAPAKVLAIVEEAASRTLSEMRRIVGALRNDADAEYAPAASLADIERLGRNLPPGLALAVSLSGDLDDLDSTLQSTVYRLAQESVTNAVRHARGASRIDVRVESDAGQVRLTVADDGEPVDGRSEPGFGLQGMAERVALLGGTLDAGPGEDRGWVVVAKMPKRGADA